MEKKNNKAKPKTKKVVAKKTTAKTGQQKL